MKRTPTNRTEAVNIAAKRKQSIEVGTEETLQASIKKAFEERYPEKIGRLFATFQNPTKEQYGLWITKGFVPGVSDMIFIDDHFRLIALEIKHPDKVHKRDHVIRQAKWIINNAYAGGFCTSVEMFFDIIERRNNGINPKKLLVILENNSEKQSVVFKDYLYL